MISKIVITENLQAFATFETENGKEVQEVEYNVAIWVIKENPQHYFLYRVGNVKVYERLKKNKLKKSW